MSLASLSSLLKQSQITDHEELLQAADTALKANKNDIDAQHVKAIALLKLDRFDDAARLFETGNAALKDKAKLEYAYALYKAGRRKEAADVTANAEDRGLQHVRAQAMYGIEEFAQAAQIYGDMELKLAGDNGDDISLNRSAIDAQLEWSHQPEHKRQHGLTREDMMVYEGVYNGACAEIAKGDYQSAETLLARAHYLCSQLEDLSSQEKETELLPIKAQQVCVLTKLGKLDGAADLARTIDGKALPDAGSRYLARFNSFVIDSAANPFLLERQIAGQDSIPEADRLFTFQSTVLDRDRYATDLATLKSEGIASRTSAELSKAPLPDLSARTNNLSVFAAAAKAQNQDGKDAIKLIRPLVEQRPLDIGLNFTLMQLLVQTNNHSAAITQLETLFAKLEESGNAEHLAVRYAPALVGTAVGLYASQRRRQQIRTELRKAAQFWRSSATKWTASRGLSNLLKTAGSNLADSEEPEDRNLAAAIFKDLHEHDKHSHYAAYGVLATSEASGATDTKVLIRLGSLIDKIDVDALESAGVAQRASTLQTQSKKRPAPETPVKKTKKIRKSKMPRDFDPNKKMDPERWLPLRDRSTYRPKGKKGKARQAMLSQGAVLTESDNSRPATPGAETLKGKAPANNANKKKKKGKK